ncbi:MAG: ATP-binding cassette domain-containing protein [Proteobacteria bacterium]|nr:ATP-binding cassette domain-containing protein [Pseudomonadota bacterium]
MVFLKVMNLVKKFDSVTAVDDISFEVEKGEFLTLLGPSGCGKTTILRCIAGLETPDQGDIFIGEKLVLSREKDVFVQPDKRGLGMVFQSYAIWPHLSVFDNIAYPLVERRLKKNLLREKVKQILEMVKLSGLEDRSATKLSGGQQQRVALARALIYDPEVLLFDEPLSNLDAKLRIEMRNEIRNLQKNLAITSIYVTHDQEEAFALSDRIIVMNDGKIEQVGDPVTLYFKPETRFVSQFIGQTNYIEGAAKNVDEKGTRIDALGTMIEIAGRSECKKGDKVFLSIRPEYIKINPKDQMENELQGKVEQRQYLGSYGRFYVSVQGNAILVERHDISENDVGILPKEGDTVRLGFHSRDCLLVK